VTTISIPVEEISKEAAKLDPRKVAVTILVVVPFMLGWTVRKLWLALAFLWTAAVVGWREAAPRTPSRDG
jgi:hypothetical protein